MPTPEYVLWGFMRAAPNGHWQRVPVALTGGNLRHCRAEARFRSRLWECAIYLDGTRPDGLRLRALIGY